MEADRIWSGLRIGQRMVKTALSVFLCFVIDYFRASGNPFYSTIAAVVSTQRSVEDSWQAGRQRIIATILGGLYGLAVTIFEVYVYSIPHELWRNLALSLALIPLIKLTVSLKQPQGVPLTCIIYLSIVISNPAEFGAADAFSYAGNRILDTLIGVLVAVGVNALPFNFRKGKQNRGEAEGAP